MCNRESTERAISPVVGIMLMLVVTVIIAAVVSGFAGGMASGQKKVPQAAIQATFSQTGGMTIVHAGGDPLATAGLIFTVSDNPEFGQGLSAVTTQVLNASIITDTSNNAIRNPDGTSNLTVFKAGDTLYINKTNIDPQYFQPSVAPCDSTATAHSITTSPACTSSSKPNYAIYWTGSGWDYDGSKTSFWNLVFVNPNNVGKTFSFTVSDKAGNTISQSDVTIIP
ncbi:MAG: type IV pilin N-terminal domain-containing protein [Methanoregula sp.]|nr:type IV pilin N-terminal domain-containing protein [Methanoregula sp.]